MTNQLFSLVPLFVDSKGAPRSGAQLFFYESGTNTKLATYQDRALTVANPNPVPLNSAGVPDNPIFLQDRAYKVVLAPSTDSDPPSSPILTRDPVYASDFSTVARFQSGDGNPNGSVAGTAGTASTDADAYWDFTNKILYVCTTTGNAAAAVWTAINGTAAAQVVVAPQGYLTTSSGVPVITADAVGVSTVHYTPYVGNLIPLYNGAAFNPTEFTELSISLVTAHASNTIYDLFVFLNETVPTLVTGPAWATSTAGSGDRGTGSSTTQIQKINGLWVNSVAMTGRNGNDTFAIGANLATYVGSLLVDATAGQTTCHRGFGQSRKWGVWNAYNRAPVRLRVGDSTASWTYGTSAFRASNGSTANSATVFTGLAEELMDIQFQQNLLTGSSTPSNNKIGVGFDSTTVVSGYSGVLQVSNTENPIGQLTANHTATPILGVSVVTCLENGNGVATNFSGTEADMLMEVSYRA